MCVVHKNWLQHFLSSSIVGQSMQAQGTTSLVEMGIAPNLIQVAGRWTLKTFNCYVWNRPFLFKALLVGQSSLLLPTTPFHFPIISLFFLDLPELLLMDCYFPHGHYCDFFFWIQSPSTFHSNNFKPAHHFHLPIWPSAILVSQNIYVS